MDKELNQLKPAGLPVDKQIWNIEDLQSYIGAMKADITIVGKLIREKSKAQLAVNALFTASAN